MRDFTLNAYRQLLTLLLDHNYTFLTFNKFLKSTSQKFIILRHDVDSRKINSLTCAKLENELGISGTYYFRIVPDSFDVKVIKKIFNLSHEIGYHYEDLSVARGNHDIAIKLFTENLAILRRVVPIETICMHGSPLSKYDNRKLWDKYNYRDYGLLGEPYLDTDFNKILYLTDTGRRWDGEAVTIRDKMPCYRHQAPGNRSVKSSGLRDQEKQRIKNNKYPEAVNRFHSTWDIINAARENRLPDKIMITVHPQRWDDNIFPWLKELIWQNVKNIIKRAVAEKHKR